MAPLHIASSANLLVGIETGDDAGVYRLDGERALVVTADFITPVVDDPGVFGAVAAANSLSDVYAMGGRPLTALNLCGYPETEVAPEVLVAILEGAARKCTEAGCAVAGGHTVRDTEIKFGLAVTGIVHPERILRNSGVRPGDRIVLTKPLGTGALVGALRQGKLPAGEGQERLVQVMTTLNTPGPDLWPLGVRSATDVTGFGLTGHALTMARASGVSLILETSQLPLLPGAVQLCAAGFTCGGTRLNAAHVKPSIAYAQHIDEGMIGLLNDPQTSGGLLVAVPPERLADLLAALPAAGALCAAVIGEAREPVAGQPLLRCL